MSSNFMALRSAIAAVLAVIIVVNLLFVSFHENNTVLVNAKEGLDKAISSVMLDDYTMALKEELYDAKKSEILDQIKEELWEKNKAKVLEDLKKDLDENTMPKYRDDLRKKIEAEYTTEFFNNRKLDYTLLEEMKEHYYKKNEKLLKDVLLLEALDTVLEGEKGKAELKDKVSEELNVLRPRKTWFTHVLKDVILTCKPQMGPLTDEERGEDLRFCRRVVHTTVYDKGALDRVRFSPERKKDFKDNHDKLVAKLQLMDAPPASVFSGAGIVISGGGPYTAGALVAIIQVREMGSKLPIELIINSKEEYDKHICEELGGQFNFKCVIIEEEIGKDLIKELNIKKFQLKIMGLLVTSFDHVIALDADNMPLKNVDDLFTSPSYLETGFLLWPDLWQRTVSKQYYDIAGIVPGEPQRRSGIDNNDDFAQYYKRGRDAVHFHDLENLPDHVSTETGQMVFSKRAHFRSFLLALYYNMYGPTHYWRLFYQGSPGTGDRDTFVPALHVFNEPYAVTEHNTWLAGFHQPDGFFQETTIVQYDPDTSRAFANGWKQWLIEQNMDLRMRFVQDNDYTRNLVKEFQKTENAPPYPEVLFLHIHRPKINAIFATDKEGYFEWNKQRNLGKVGEYKNHFGTTDWDLRFYAISKWVACKGLKSKSWWESVDRDQAAVCEEATKYVDFLKEDTNDHNAENFKLIH